MIVFLLNAYLLILFLLVWFKLIPFNLFTAKVARLGCVIYEVGISYSGRDYSQGKKIGWKDGVRALWCIVRYSVF